MHSHCHAKSNKYAYLYKRYVSRVPMAFISYRLEVATIFLVVTIFLLCNFKSLQLYCDLHDLLWLALHSFLENISENTFGKISCNVINAFMCYLMSGGRSCSWGIFSSWPDNWRRGWNASVHRGIKTTCSSASSHNRVKGRYYRGNTNCSSKANSFTTWIGILVLSMMMLGIIMMIIETTTTTIIEEKKRGRQRKRRRRRSRRGRSRWWSRGRYIFQPGWLSHKCRIYIFRYIYLKWDVCPLSMTFKNVLNLIFHCQINITSCSYIIQLNALL